MRVLRFALIAALLASARASEFNHKADMAANVFLAMAVRQEMNNIANVLFIDFVTGELPAPQNFPGYLRSNFVARSTYGERDVSRDYWGNQYRLELRRGFPFVVSAGPDGRYGTGDDIRIGFAKYDPPPSVTDNYRQIASGAPQIPPLQLSKAAADRMLARRTDAVIRDVRTIMLAGRMPRHR